MDPKAIIFLCNWSSYPGLQYAEIENGKETKDNEVIISACAGRLAPELVVEAFNKGAWGVLIASCPPGECEHDGNYKIRRRVLLLKNTLKQFGIDPKRLKLDWVDKADTAKFTQVRKDFLAEIKELGPVKDMQAV
ncbi:hydrogenase iron-sulfur subunit [candidate division KSB1 bacterium]